MGIPELGWVGLPGLKGPFSCLRKPNLVLREPYSGSWKGHLRSESVHFRPEMTHPRHDMAYLNQDSVIPVPGGGGAFKTSRWLIPGPDHDQGLGWSPNGMVPHPMIPSMLSSRNVVHLVHLPVKAAVHWDRLGYALAQSSPNLTWAAMGLRADSACRLSVRGEPLTR